MHENIHGSTVTADSIGLDVYNLVGQQIRVSMSTRATNVTLIPRNTTEILLLFDRRK